MSFLSLLFPFLTGRRLVRRSRAMAVAVVCAMGPVATLAALDPQPLSGHCSIASGPSTSETIVNNSSEAVNVYWVDSSCVEQPLFHLPSGTSYVQQVYTGHVWRMRSAATGSLLKETVALPHQTMWVEGSGACSAGAVPAVWTFENATSSSLDLFWIDWQCKEMKLAKVSKGKTVSFKAAVGTRFRYKVAGKTQVVGEASVVAVGPTWTRATAVGTAPLSRTSSERKDDSQSFQVKVLYAMPKNGVDGELDSSGRIAHSISAGQQWLLEQSGGRTLRFDTSQSKLDVTYVKLPRTSAQYAAFGDYARNEIERDLFAKGFQKANKMYLVFYDGAGTSCGSSYLGPSYLGAAVVYLQTCTEPLTGDASRIGLTELSWLHEVFHALGAAPSCAPHHVQLPVPAGHVSDNPSDLMYSGPAAWRPALLDSGRDDYWATGNPGCFDVAASSPFLN